MNPDKLTFIILASIKNDKLPACKNLPKIHKIMTEQDEKTGKAQALQRLALSILLQIIL